MSSFRGRANPHTLLVDSIILEVSKRANTFACKMQGGKFRALTHDQVVTIGVPGFSDIFIQAVGPKGPFTLYLECKTGKARLKKGQKIFMQVIRECGGHYYETRSLGDAIRAFDSLYGMHPL